MRREYLYRKSLEGKERLLYEKKRKIKQALEGRDPFPHSYPIYSSMLLEIHYLLLCLFLIWAEGKPIPTELRNEEAALRQEIDLEDQNTAGLY